MVHWSDVYNKLLDADIIANTAHVKTDKFKVCVDGVINAFHFECDFDDDNEYVLVVDGFDVSDDTVRFKHTVKIDDLNKSQIVVTDLSNNIINLFPHASDTLPDELQKYVDDGILIEYLTDESTTFFRSYSPFNNVTLILMDFDDSQLHAVIPAHIYFDRETGDFMAVTGYMHNGEMIFMDAYDMRKHKHFVSYANK